jgi:alcohol dehydrogenase class IV
MDFNTILQAVSMVGFPIVCAVILAYVVKYMFDKYSTDIKNLTDAHKNECDKFADALNANTVAITKLCERLEKEDKNDDGR